ncbi:phosphatase PAP2 family protein [Paenibacillus cineris]|uniref:phosphatase PAP2 family protein n=1 Tax=Paenibacillus cineris TaxID=237530 RepID=UPI001B17F607|nr:phosphatase PAP2 family protein [Paenibacillus cineris]GIO58437.1 hypothetical protein J43TS9_00110 [Paenibacillus cineris]
MLYDSMNYISAATLVTAIGLIWLGTLRNPLRAGWLLIREFGINRKFLGLFALMAAILLFNRYELQIEAAMHVKQDFTPWVFGIEGHFVQHLQQFFHSPYITPVSVFFYVVVFQSLLIAMLGIFAADRNKAFLMAACIAVFINYAVAIPFYLFFPVNEVWSFPPSGASFYMLEVFPKFEQAYRPLSGINNCFPSLHTSISITMLVLGIRSGNPRLALMTLVSAIIIIFSIFYLGIHWLTDSVAGTLLGLLAASAGIYWGRRLAHPKQQKVKPIVSDL